MDKPYTPPVFEQKVFNCPHCFAYAKQRWGYPHRQVEGINEAPVKSFAIARCDHCGKYTIWVDQELVYPASLAAPKPNQDLPDDIKNDFEEARRIVSDSPRGAAALLRLCIQKLCKYLGESGENINNDIASLVKKGLPVKVQQALDIVRVVGNNAVHPGQIDLKDDIETANILFALVNLVADVMLTQPKHVEEMYNSIIPEGAKEAIERRDNT
ncbi:MAG: DUF4145 domain-containing protein [Deltaproteobacteria bacterium]|nr:DUF4145 domain-containing protein [Deltaproteobacteria bacterium]